MIYHIQTFCTYGYWPEDLKPKSHKLIIVVCDDCGKPNYWDVPKGLVVSCFCEHCGGFKRFYNPFHTANDSDCDFENVIDNEEYRQGRRGENNEI